MATTPLASLASMHGLEVMISVDIEREELALHFECPEALAVIKRTECAVFVSPTAFACIYFAGRSGFRENIKVEYYEVSSGQLARKGRAWSEISDLDWPLQAIYRFPDGGLLFINETSIRSVLWRAPLETSQVLEQWGYASRDFAYSLDDYVWVTPDGWSIREMFSPWRWVS